MSVNGIARTNILDQLVVTRPPPPGLPDEMPDDLPPFPPIDAYVEVDAQPQPKRTRHAEPTATPWGEKAKPAAFTAAELLAPIEPERYLIPGLIPCEAYTVIAGALSAAKTTLLHSLLIWRATGFDILDLDPEGGGLDPSPCVLLSYEDSDRRILRRFQILVQHFHAQILHTHGARVAQQFIALLERNLRRVTLTGEPGAGIVTRFDGVVVANHLLIEHLLAEVGAFAPRDVLIGLDPLRLAIVGSQNDDDGADTVVHVLNRIANHFPDSGVVLATHTTKSTATNRDGTDSMEAASYATSGSALYSQHARSNLHLARLKPEAMRSEFAPGTFSDEEIAKQLATCLTHGRLSHGTASDKRYFAMRGGVLVPVDHAAGTMTAADRAKQYLPAICAAIERLKASGVTTISQKALESDDALRAALGGRSSLRGFLDLSKEQGWLSETGEGRAKRMDITEAGRNFAGISGEVR